MGPFTRFTVFESSVRGGFVTEAAALVVTPVLSIKVRCVFACA